MVASLLFLPESVYSLPGDTRPIMGISIWTQYVLDNFCNCARSCRRTEKRNLPHRRSTHAEQWTRIYLALSNYRRNRKYGNLGISRRETEYSRTCAMYRFPLGINTPDKPHISSTVGGQSPIKRTKVYYFESTLTPNLFWLDLKKIDFSPSAKVEKLPLSNGEIWRRRCYKRFTRQQTFRFSVLPGDVIHRAFHHRHETQHNKLYKHFKTDFQIYRTNQTLNTTLHLSEENFSYFYPKICDFNLVPMKLDKNKVFSFILNRISVGKLLLAIFIIFIIFIDEKQLYTTHKIRCRNQRPA